MFSNFRFYSLIGPGDTINVIGDFDDQGQFVVDHDHNLIIVQPDILVSGTRVLLFKIALGTINTGAGNVVHL